MDLKTLVRLAKAQHHKPYILRPWSNQEIYNENPENFDCSSLMMWLYFVQGYKIPRTSQQQFNFCIDSGRNIGDLFFYGVGGNSKSINHVGMYIGSGMCIEAAGGRAGKVIFSQADKNENKGNFIAWCSVPLYKAEERFFIYIKNNPKKKKGDV